MPEYYLDVETTGTDIEYDKIVTIQYQELDSKTGKPLNDLTILKSWEYSEREILEKFYELFKPNEPFNFIPIGTNLPFDLFMLHNRWKLHGINVSLRTLLYDHPCIDIKPILVIVNGGRFLGAKLENLGYKKFDGSNVPLWYSTRDYHLIEKYIIDEAKGFIEFYQRIKSGIYDLHKTGRF